MREKRKHLLCLSLVIPEEPADDPDLRIGAPELNVADVQDYEPIGSERRIILRHAAFAGLAIIGLGLMLIGRWIGRGRL